MGVFSLFGRYKNKKMKIKPFSIERYFAKHEFSAPYLLSCSDAEPLSLSELLGMADAESQQLWDNLSLGYTESQGHPGLLQAIAHLYPGITTQNILGVVPEEGIFISMNMLLEAGDHVIVTHPGYQSLYQIAVSIGCNVSWWEPHLQTDMAFYMSDLESLITPKTKLIVINFPHNPTGSLISKQQQSELVRIAQENKITIFSDEMYRFAELDAADRLPSMVERYEKGVVLGGLSKSFSLPGLRVGWLASQDMDFIRAAMAFKDYTTICAAAPSEILGMIALESKDKIFKRNLAIYQNNLSALEEFFTLNNTNFRWVQPKSGTIIFPEITGDMSADELCQKLLDQSGVMLLPASILGYDGNYVRIGFGRRDLPENLDKFDEFLNDLKK